MQTIGIKDLQKNPATLTKSLQNKEFTIITKRSKPIGLAISFENEIITEGLKKALLMDAYKKGLLSLGQVSKDLKLTKIETMKMLSNLGIDIVSYDFEDDKSFVESF